MTDVNANYLKLQGSYLFSTIAKKVAAYKAAHPQEQVISLGIGDVSQPLVPAVVEALHRACDEMAHPETFRGYGPEQGYVFLREAVLKGDYLSRGIALEADEIFIAMCNSILKEGYSTEGEKVRPKWPDGSFAYTIKKFGVVNRYDLREEFPILTLRKTALKSATDELLWIWQKKSNNIHDLNSHIWDEWADEKGSIGKAYGYQLGVKHQYKEDQNYKN